MLELNIKIMIFNVRTKLDFLNLENLLFFLGFLFALLLFLSILTIVHDTAYWRLAIRSYFHQVKTAFFCFANGIANIHNA